MKKSSIILFHTVYWLSSMVSILVFYTFTYASIQHSGSIQLKYLVVWYPMELLIKLVSFYIFYLYFFPQYLAKQKIRLFIIYGFIAIMLIIIVGEGIFYYNANVLYHTKTAPYMVFNAGYGLFLQVVSTAIAGCMGRGIISWYGDIKYKKDLENRNLHTELALLKAQINPHFLFNTLNNIDILMEKDAATASIYLKKLSDILRFMLYETSASTIPLTSELAYIREYIELQKIRTANPDFVKFEVSGHTEGLHVAPMIFIPFIENAFKHSTNKKVDTAIDIKFAIENDNIIFSCVNVFDYKNALQQPNSGLGLELMENRLNLLYKDNHELVVEQTDNRYAVHLTIKADDH